MVVTEEMMSHSPLVLVVKPLMELPGNYQLRNGVCLYNPCIFRIIRLGFCLITLDNLLDYQDWMLASEAIRMMLYNYTVEPEPFTLIMIFAITFSYGC